MVVSGGDNPANMESPSASPTPGYSTMDDLLEGDVTSVESPARFFCRTRDDADQFRALKRMLNRRCYDNPQGLLQVCEVTADPSLSNLDLALWHEGCYWRARPSGRRGVFDLVDDGRAVRPALDAAVHRLDPRFGLDIVPPLCFRCHLSDVVSSVHLPYSWPPEACTFFAKSARECPSVLIQRRGEAAELMGDGFTSLPVELHFREEVTELFKESLPVLVSMSTKLLKQSMAVPIMLIWDEELHDGDFGDEAEAANVGEDQDQFLDLDRSSIARRDDDDENEVCNCSSLGGEEDDSDVVSKWLPPAIPKPGSFPARVTHVSNRGQIYFQRLHDVQLVRTITRHLNATYGALGIAGEEDEKAVLQWREGQACVALYSDECWYRAQLVKIVDGKTAGVLFVDFGNVTVVKTKDLRLARDFRSVRMLASRMILTDLLPRRSSTWPKEVLDVMFDLLYYKNCGGVQVSVAGRQLPQEGSISFRPDHNPPYEDFAKYLVNANLAIVVRGLDLTHKYKMEFLEDGWGVQGVECDDDAPRETNSVVSSSVTDSSSTESLNCPFKTRELSSGDVNGLIPVNVQVVKDKGVCFFHVRNDGNPSEFKDFTVTFSSWAKEQPPAVLEVGAAVAVRYADGNWYRGVIVAIENGTPRVWYADIGSVEPASIRYVRQLPEQFHRQPPLFAVQAKLNYPMLKDPMTEARTLDHIRDVLKGRNDVYFKRESFVGKVPAGTLYIKRQGKLRCILEANV